MSHFRALIIGAGASGIAAASRLAEQGFKDFIILEAENRIGGRIHTCEFGERDVDMGAEWVHGEKNNVSFSLANPHGLLEGEDGYILETQFVTSSGDLVPGDFSDRIMSIVAQINESAKNDLVGYHGSLGEYFTKEFESKIENEDNRELDKKLAREYLDWYHKFENSLTASDSWFNTSGKGHIEYWECEGHPMLNWKKGGYSTVLDLLTRRYPDPKNELPVMNKVQFNKEVNSIKWDGHDDPSRKDKVSVTCVDGSEYIAERVIITVSLGFLKENINLFSPELPSKKLNAIKGLEFGLVDKIHVRYPHSWWPQNCLGFNFVWNEEDKMAFEEELMKNGVQGKEWLFDVFGFYAVRNHPLCLCGWVMGPSARAMEQVTDDELKESCTFLLNYFLGKSFSIPRVEEMKRSTWFTNRHFRGSYSYRSMDTEKMGTSAEHLSNPLTNANGSTVLQFAGEATHPHYFSTVHGAIESGQREADYLLKSIRTQHKCYDNSRIMKTPDKLTKCDVVIIGAGMAGLGAARTLINGGLTNIAILEAQDYAGGRVRSVCLGKSFIEAGAQWIHGEDNDVFKIAKKYNLTSNVESFEGLGMYLREDGSSVKPHLIDEVKEAVENILEECESFAKNSNAVNGVPSSVGEFLKQKFKDYVTLCRQSGESEETISIKEELYDWHERFQEIDNSCRKLDNLSAKSWGNYEFCSGTERVNFKNGYSSLVEKLVSELPQEILRLNCPVQEVKWKTSIELCSHAKTNRLESLTNELKSKENKQNGEVLDSKVCCSSTETQPVMLVCEDGSQYSARHVIVTCSLGFLKENHKKMFIPHLPKWSQSVIEDIGFAAINKIFLDFGSPWWKPHVKGFQILWSKKRENSQSTNQDNWTRDISGFDVLHNHNGVLLGWVGSFGAEIVEKLSEDEVGRQCTMLLRQFMPGEDIPFPKRVIRSSWFSNPYVRGAYSHTTSRCDSSGSSPSLLAEPIYSKFTPDGTNDELKHPTILFAGEAAHDRFFSTTHGAFESGKDQAKVILDAWHNSRNQKAL